MGIYSICFIIYQPLLCQILTAQGRKAKGQEPAWELDHAAEGRDSCKEVSDGVCVADGDADGDADADSEDG